MTHSKKSSSSCREGLKPMPAGPDNLPAASLCVSLEHP